MSVLHRVYLSIIHNKKRYCILLCVFFALFLVLLTVYFAYASSQNQISFIRKSLSNMITIHKKTDDGSIGSFSTEDIQKIREFSEIEAVNVLTFHETELQNSSPYIEDEESAQEYNEFMQAAMGAFGISGYVEANSRTISITDSESSIFYSGSGFDLIKGKPITERDTDKKVVLISEEVAKKNHLNIGDSIEVKLPYMDRYLGMSSSSIIFKIQGIFRWDSLAESEMQVSACPANFLFVPEGILKANYNMDPTILYANTKDGFLIDDTVSKLKEVLGESSPDSDQQEGKFIYDWDSAWAEEVGKPLMDVEKVTFIILVILFTGIMIIIGIVTSFILKEKQHEIKIYWALGEKKIKILLQNLLEVMCVIVSAAIIAAVAATIITPMTNRTIVEPYSQIIETKLDTEKNEQLFNEKRTGAFFEDAVYSNNTYLKNSSQSIPFQLSITHVLVLLIVVFVFIPIIVSCILLWRLCLNRMVC